MQSNQRNQILTECSLKTALLIQGKEIAMEVNSLKAALLTLEKEMEVPHPPPPPQVTVLNYLENTRLLQERIKKAIQDKITQNASLLVFPYFKHSIRANVFEVDVDGASNRVDFNRFLALLPKAIEELSVGKNTFTFIFNAAYFYLHATTRYWVPGYGWVTRRVKLTKHPK